MTDVALMQPTFLPWLGYFELIDAADTFVLLDDFQLSYRSFHRRNRLFVTRGEAGWYSLPVRAGSSRARLNEAPIADEPPWREPMWKRIEANYARAPFFDAVAPAVREWLFAPAESVAAMNSAFIARVCEILGIATKFRRSSEHPSGAKRSTRILELLEWCGASRYRCAHGSFDYMRDDGVFPAAHVEVLFQDHVPVPYPQIGSPEEFVPYLSVLDALFNAGPQRTLELVRGGTKRWLTWSEMR
ncbi:MAG TPA: WbqC family protein [Thermoanaerobaculia bacterium]|nr:WbqC family protein [Thermoanaerobaculia bacterium]